MSGLPTRLVVLPLSRAAPLLNLGPGLYRLIGSIQHSACRQLSTSHAAAAAAAAAADTPTPPPPGSKPSAVATNGTPANSTTPPPSAAEGAAKERVRKKSRLPTLLLLVTPAVAHATYQYYEPHLPEEVKPYAQQAKAAADDLIKSAETAAAPVFSYIRDTFPFLDITPEPATSTRTAEVAVAVADGAPFQKSVSPVSPDQQVEPNTHHDTAAEKSEALVEVVDITLLDQLLNEALVSDVESPSTPPSVVKDLLPHDPALEEAVNKLEKAVEDAVSVVSEVAERVETTAGGVDAEHHVPTAAELLQSAAAGLGISLDLSPSGLVRHADQVNAGARDDWKSFAAQHRQATADAVVFQQALEQIRKYHEQELARLKLEIKAAEDRAVKIKQDAEAMAENLKGVLKIQQQQAIEESKQAVQRAEQELLTNQAQIALQERRERLTVLEQIRNQLNKVSAVATTQTKHFLAASAAQQRYLGIQSLQYALDSGSSLNAAITGLQQSCKGDDASQVALAALPQADSLPTSSELIHSLSAMKKHVASLSYLPEGGGGILATAFSYLATSLKFKEAEDSPTRPALTTDAALTAAQQLVLDGKVAEAADVVQDATKGTAAASLVRPWVKQARSVAIARQSLEFLTAQTSTLVANAP